MSNLKINQDQQNQLFFIKLQNAQAYLKYDKPDDGILNLKATYVPLDSRGKGIGSALAKYALNYAKNKHCKVMPS